MNIEPALALRRFRDTYAAEILAELGEDKPKHFPFARYGTTIRTTQGVYLTRATPRLLRLAADMGEIQAAVFDAGAEAASGHEEFAEGQRLQREIFFFSRNPRLTAAAKAHYGFCCAACGFNFEAAYGLLGRGYIECHHLDPLSERAEIRDSEDITTSIEQVAVLCANCHRMIHRKRPALTIDLIRHSLQKT